MIPLEGRLISVVESARERGHLFWRDLSDVPWNLCLLNFGSIVPTSECVLHAIELCLQWSLLRFLGLLEVVLISNRRVAERCCDKLRFLGPILKREYLVLRVLWRPWLVLRVIKHIHRSGVATVLCEIVHALGVREWVGHACLMCVLTAVMRLCPVEVHVLLRFGLVALQLLKERVNVFILTDLFRLAHLHIRVNLTKGLFDRLDLLTLARRHIKCLHMIVPL